MTSQEKIFESALVFLGQNPGASIQKIIDDADVSRRTFYKYFSSREDLQSKAAHYAFDKIFHQMKGISLIDEFIEKGIMTSKYYAYLMLHPTLYFDPEVYLKYKSQKKEIWKIIKNDSKYSFDFSKEWLVNYLEALILFSHNMIMFEKKSKKKVLSEALLSLKKLSS